jgi:hypothetical protein
MEVTSMFDLKTIVFSKRKSVKRAVARFLHLKNIQINEEEFLTLVRRTQSSGYKSAIKYLSTLLEPQNLSLKDKKQLLLQFTIEYNIELYCRQFPSGNKSVERILSGEKTAEDEQFFREFLYEIVKANKLQLQIIDKYL